MEQVTADELSSQKISFGLCPVTMRGDERRVNVQNRLAGPARAISRVAALP